MPEPIVWLDRSTDELVVTALAASTDADDDEYWQPLRLLQDRGTDEVFSAAPALSHGDNPNERMLGVRVLSHGQSFVKTFRNEAVSVLLQLLEHESEPSVLTAVCIALGHWQDPRSIDPVSRLRNHSDSNVRYGAVMGLLGQNDPVAIEALIALSEDIDSDVRDWATFGLGTQIDSDTALIREALARRLDDDDTDTRLEALIGVARRKDERALAPLLEELSPDRVVPGVLAAAEAFADPRLCPALLRLKEAGFTSANPAIVSCNCEIRDQDS
jgi:hypothetical protein